MTIAPEVQTVSDSQGNAVAVIVPIDVWRRMQLESATAPSQRSETLQKRLQGARERNARVSDEELSALMAEFADEDRELAEMGMEDYARGLAREDAR
jgi:thioesterase domain-containing protein